MKKEKESQILGTFYLQKVLTKTELTELLNCSGRTAQRKLFILGALTSYNKNSRYYTLPDIPVFNCYGIWHYRGILFSKYGNISKTIVQLIKDSEAGLSGHDLENILGLSPYTFLQHLQINKALSRKKINNRFVYFFRDIEQNQEKKRKGIEKEAGLPSDAVAVMVLVLILKYPNYSIEDLVISLNSKGITCPCNSIESLFDYHGLKKNLIEKC